MRPIIHAVKMLTIVKMYLLLEVLVALLAEAAAHFDDLAEMSHFTVIDTIRLSLWRADLVLEINLREIFEAIQATCSLAASTNNTVIPDAIERHLQEVCDFDIHNWRTFHDFLTGSNAERRPRFILATLISSLVMGVGGYIFGSSHATSQTDTQLLANQEHIVQILRENDHRAVLMQSEISSLAHLMAKNAASTQSVMLLLSIMFMQSKQLAVIFRGLETLIVDKKLAPGLISPDLLHKKYGHLSKQLSKQNKHLSIAAELDLFNCPASFATFTNEVLRIVVHIPVFDKRLGDFTLYKYLNIPLVHNDEHFQIQHLRDEYLAVSQNHEFYFLAASLDLDRCTPLAGVLSCSHFGGMYSASVPSCLWGVFSADQTMVHETCPLRTMGTVDRFWPLINDQFVVFLGVPDTVFIYCDGRISDSAHFAGLKVISVPKNCYAKSKSFQFFAGAMVLREDALLKLAPVRVDPSSFRSSASAPAEVEGLAREAARDVHIPTDLPFSFTFWQLYGGYIGAASLVIIILVVLALFVKWKKQPRTVIPDA